ncbi:virulence protein RhuM/Fic/DOC family protein, partial [Candidatus Dojkabacteria bacterium]|nr:virulence protein RhuM/Fic/DOC family protein [Candidatus Dojkabacteria bacterium]
MALNLKIYQDNDGLIKFKTDTPISKLWLSQKDMADFYGVHKTIINKYVNKVFDNKEINKRGNIDRRKVDESTKPIQYYSFKIFTAIGFKIQSYNAVLFRKWMIESICEYKDLEEMYEEKVEEIQDTIEVIDRETHNNNFQGQERELLALIDDYTSTWSLFHKYDHQNLEITSFNKQFDYNLTLEDTQTVIESLRVKLRQRFEVTDLFAKEVDNKFVSIIGAVNQVYGDSVLYPSLEEKAANLLYLVIKDHPFVDGNKRVASLLFIYFLERNNYSWKVSKERKINDNALVTLALLIANSKPDEKE